MIEATVNKGHVKCSIEERGISILSELIVLVDCVLDKMADEDKAAKDELLEVFCNGLNYIKDMEK